MMEQDFMRRFGERLAERVHEAQVDVFVMGPHVPPRKADSELSSSARLRKFLIQRLQSEGYAVPPDLKAVIALTEKHLGKGVDLATVEHTFAEEVDLLIFIPDSNGSAAEAGYFAGLTRLRKTHLGTKAVVLLSATSKSNPGYVALGPARQLRAAGARVHYVNYSHRNVIWKIVENEVADARSLKVVRPTLGLRL
ncbi:MAG: hypothetical protein KDB14_33330 [Planctomycetales bacterium]|nr:hypothetical protein [Planctomycetales bacterium]